MMEKYAPRPAVQREAYSRSSMLQRRGSARRMLKCRVQSLRGRREDYERVTR